MLGSRDRIIIHDKITNIKPVLNRVLVKVGKVDNNKSSNGLYLGDSEWDKSGHLNRRGEVIRLPSKLWFAREFGFGIQWGTEMEVEEGDIVYFGIMSVYDAPAIIDDGVVYLLIQYHDLLFSLRGNKVIPLNGYVLIEKVDEKVKQSSLILDFNKKQDKKRGIVRYIGKPNSYYDSGMCDSIGFDVGDEVDLMMINFTFLEDKRYRTFEKNIGYVQRRWIRSVT